MSGTNDFFLVWAHAPVTELGLYRNETSGIQELSNIALENMLCRVNCYTMISLITV